MSTRQLKVGFLVLIYCISVNFSLWATDEKKKDLRLIKTGINFTGDINYNFKLLENRINNLKGKKDIPVGTILCSLLKPEQFITKEMKEIWVPADGRDTPSNSLYREKSLPDLRGVFLRGKNTFSSFKGPRTDQYSDTGKRDSSGFQMDGIRNHTHSVPYKTQQQGHAGYGNIAAMTSYSSIFYNLTGLPVDGSAEETMPKNMAVYYYIKIN